MTPDELVGALEDGRILATDLPKDHEGVGEAYFRRVAQLVGSNPKAAIQLGALWRGLIGRVDSPGHVWRAHAVVQRIQGKWLSAARSFEKAAQVAQDPIFMLGAVDSYARAGRIDEAIGLAESLIKSLKSAGDHIGVARTSLNLGNTLVWADRYAEADGAYRVAVAGLEGVERAAAQLGLSTCRIYSGAVSESKALAAAALEFFENSNMPAYADEARTNLAQAHILTGEPERGLDILQALTFPNVRTQEFLGDAYFQLNLFELAEECYELAKKEAYSPLNIANCLLGIGLCRLQLSDLKTAKEKLAGARRLYRHVGNVPWMFAAQTWLAQCSRKMGTSGWQRLAQESANELRRHRSTYHEASAHLETGSNLTRAAQLIERNQYFGLAWRLHYLRAQVARSPLPHFRRMLEAMLVVRLLTRSQAAKMSFLRDKDVALRSYLAYLLNRGSEQYVREALDVVRRTRAATLIDEIASAAQRGDADWMRELEQVRTELAQTISSPDPGNTRKGKEVHSSTESGVRRLRVLSSGVLQLDGTATVCIETESSLFLVGDGLYREVGLSWSDLEQHLRWLQFDLMEPMLSKDAPAEKVSASIRALRDTMGAIPVEAISPDSLSWRIPWQLIADDEPVLSLLPTGHISPGKLVLPASPKVGIWLASRQQLEHVDSEVAALRALFPQAEVFDNMGSLADMTGEFDLLHVVGHARLNKQNPMFSAIDFGDWSLRACDIASSQLRAKFVLLAACDTGAVGFTYPGEPDGLVRAFLSRGAKTVIASSWAWDDEAASRFATKFYQEFSAGSDLLAAVRMARASCRNWRAHPYYWGAPVVFAGFCADVSEGLVTAL